jgi:hypothetical protein
MKKMTVLLTLLTAIITSCSTDKLNNMTSGQNKFTWNIQLAGYDHNRADQKGETDYIHFISEFERFPWIEQIEKASQIPDKCAPTLSIKDHNTGKDFWISMAGDRNDHGYLIGYIYPKEKKSFLGLGSTKTIRWLEIYTTEDTQVVKDITKLFFDRNYVKLESTIRQLDEFDQMESKDLAN